MSFRLPKKLWSPLGPLPVTTSVESPDGESGTLGMVQFRPREVWIDKSSSLATRAQTFWHEATHLALWDGGVHNLLTPEQEEAVCDAMGGYLAAMMAAGCLTVRAPKE